MFAYAGLEISGLLIGLVAPRQLGSAKEKIAHLVRRESIGHSITVVRAQPGRRDGAALWRPGLARRGQCPRLSAFNPLGTAQLLFGATMQ